MWSVEGMESYLNLHVVELTIMCEFISALLLLFLPGNARDARESCELLFATQARQNGIPEETALTGRVLDPRGRPVTHAILLQDEDPQTWISSDGKEVLEEIGSTDPQGRFVVRGLPVGETIYGEVRASGFISEEFRVVMSHEMGDLGILLRPAGCLEGTVEDQAGERTAQVQVGLRRLGEEVPGANFGAGIEYQRTTPAGAFRFENLVPGDYEVLVKSRNLVSDPGSLLSVGPGKKCLMVAVSVRRGVIPKGRVLSPDGRPVPEAEVRILETPAAHGIDLWKQSLTDDQGQFLLRASPAGQMGLRVTHPEFAPLVTNVQLKDGADLELRFERSAGCVVAGVVVDPSGGGVAGASLILAPIGGGLNRSAHSAENGHFSFDNVPTGSYRMRVKAAGWVSLDPTLVVRACREGSELLRVGVTMGTQLYGHLTGAPLNELAQARVVATADSTVRGMVAEDGSYSLGPLSPGYWRVSASLANGREVVGSIGILEYQEESQLNLEFPLSSVAFAVRVLQDEIPLIATLAAIHSLNSWESYRATTDGTGLAHFSGVQPGVYVLEVIDPRTQYPLHREEISAEEGALLQATVSPGILRGTVRASEDGQALGNVLLRLQAITPTSTTATFRSTSNLSGDFQFSQVPAGHWRLIAKADGLSTTEAFVEIAPTEETTIDLEMESQSLLRLTLLPAHGFLSLPEQVRVSALDREGHPHFSQTVSVLPNGQVTVPGLPRGRWDIVIVAYGGMLAAELPEFQVPAPPQRVTLSERGGVRVLVPELIASRGKGTLSIVNPEGGIPLTVQAELVQGQGQALGLTPGDWVVAVWVDSDPQSQPLSERLSLQAGEIATVILSSK